MLPTPVENGLTPEIETQEVPDVDETLPENTEPTLQDDSADDSTDDSDNENDTRYQKVLRQSIKRKQRIKELESQLETKPDENDLLDALEQRILARQDEAQQAQNAVTNLMNEHSIPDGLRSIVENSSNPAETARLLGQNQKQFDKTDTGETTGETSVSDLMGTVNKRLGFN